MEHSFDIQIEEQVSWQEDESEFGESQTEAAGISSEDAATYYVYGSMSDGELFDNYQVIRARLDAIGSSYALGQMDSLTAVTAGCDAPIYTFIGIKAGDEKLKYLDIANLALTSNNFVLCTGDGECSGNYITSCYENDDTIAVSDYSFAEKLTDKSEKVYLAYVSGYDQTIVMEGKWKENDKFCFTAFSNGEEVQEKYSWVLDLVAACIENQPPTELGAYDIDCEESEMSTLFT